MELALLAIKRNCAVCMHIHVCVMCACILATHACMCDICDRAAYLLDGYYSPRFGSRIMVPF